MNESMLDKDRAQAMYLERIMGLSIRGASGDVESLWAANHKLLHTFAPVLAGAEQMLGIAPLFEWCIDHAGFVSAARMLDVLGEFYLPEYIDNMMMCVRAFDAVMNGSDFSERTIRNACLAYTLQYSTIPGRSH